MNVDLAKYWQDFVSEAVRSGRYGSPADVLHEGLRLLREREGKLEALRAKLSASIAEGGSIDDDELAQDLASHAERLERKYL